jgi:outer membrane protein TolC
MKMKRVWIIGPLVALLMMLNSGQAIAGENDLSQQGTAGNSSGHLSALVAEALANNPDLKSAEARWEMTKHKIIPAGSLDDPRLSFALSNYPVDSFAGDETPMTGKEFQLSQMLPFPGKLGSKKAMAELQAQWYRRLYEDARLQLVREVKDAWYQVYFQERAVAITRENIALLEDFTHLTETRYEVGTGLQQDVLKAQVERSKLLDRLFNLQQQHISSLAEFNRLLNRPGDIPLETPSDLEPTRVTGDLQMFVKESRSHRPVFAGYQAMVDRYQAQRKLARLDYYPDVNLWAGYRQREAVPGDPVEGTDFASAGFSINIPLWQGKRRAAVAEADSGVQMALRQLQDLGNRIDFAISDQYAKLTKNRDLVELYKTGIIPQSEQSFEATLSAYQVGDVDFLNLLDSQLTLYRYQIDYHRALSDYQRSVAGLEAAVGKELGGQNHKDRINRDIQDGQD